MLHITLKFALHSWQVPRSSVGRALYRESGPSQDGDPVPGNLPFFLFFIFSLFFSIICSFSHFIPSLQIGWSVFVYSSFLILLYKASFYLSASLPFFLTIKVMTCIGMPRNLRIVKSNNKDFADVLIL